MNKQTIAQRRNARGQGMTEYIIIVALIAVAAIGVTSLFGKTVRHQAGVVAVSIGGGDGKAANQDSKGVGNGAQAIATKPTNMSNFADEVEKK